MATEQSSKAEERARLQRNRILDAAQQRFIENGFHAASMANIADTAGMSAGLIYRYFENKSAIILAIVQRQLELLRDDIKLHRKVDLAAELVSHYGHACTTKGSGMNSALLLEISAEATRDPQIAAALDEFDRTLRGALAEWLAGPRENDGHGLPPALAQSRALLLQVLVEGLKIRETREPELDRALLETGLREIVPLLMKP
ncbi:TetR/AcrR family transcriptional regulator [Novilysobacter spongiicola]|uniref:Transcriptional regulator, TetR family n=1 Tax=Lysobacter spongiicola DSM 21749 TaxID=1122188 RepID=A0A1T4LM86_9GAMM|nr:TetR/AcrR family transcriptional regulator [Lysobacter spongiicola]SJZ55822.1 transcriptional regulator, TetR family [Lysobacter spongiicola DSM 21749]